MMHRKYFKILSQNLDYVKNYYNDGDNPFHFAIRGWTNCM